MLRIGIFWIFAACALVASLLFAPLGVPLALAQTQSDETARASSKWYYIEFRVAQIGTYGHSYVAYGRLDSRGQPTDTRYADLHPTGNYALMMLGHIFPVPANTEWNSDVLKLPVASSYRRNLTAADYRKLLLALNRARADKDRKWNAITNNCNHFVAGLAKAVGLRTPSDFQLSYSFVPALRQLNEGTPSEKNTAPKIEGSPSRS